MDYVLNQLDKPSCAIEKSFPINAYAASRHINIDSHLAFGEVVKPDGSCRFITVEVWKTNECVVKGIRHTCEITISETNSTSDKQRNGAGYAVDYPKINCHHQGKSAEAAHRALQELGITTSIQNCISSELVIEAIADKIGMVVHNILPFSNYLVF